MPASIMTRVPRDSTTSAFPVDPLPRTKTRTSIFIARHARDRKRREAPTAYAPTAPTSTDQPAAIDAGHALRSPILETVGVMCSAVE